MGCTESKKPDISSNILIENSPISQMPFDMHLLLQIAIQNAEAEKGSAVHLVEIFRAIAKNIEVMEIDDLASVLSRMVKNDEVFTNQDLTLFSLNPVGADGGENIDCQVLSKHLAQIYPQFEIGAKN